MVKWSAKEPSFFKVLSGGQGPGSSEAMVTWTAGAVRPQGAAGPHGLPKRLLPIIAQPTEHYSRLEWHQCGTH